METTTEKITKAHNHFNADQAITTKLTTFQTSQNYGGYCNEFVAEAKKINIDVTAEDVGKHFGYDVHPSFKQQVKDTVKDEVKNAAKDEATGRVEDELSNQLGVDVSGVGGAAEEVGGFFKNLFGKKKK